MRFYLTNFFFFFVPLAAYRSCQTHMLCSAITMNNSCRKPIRIQPLFQCINTFLCLYVRKLMSKLSTIKKTQFIILCNKAKNNSTHQIEYQNGIPYAIWIIQINSTKNEIPSKLLQQKNKWIHNYNRQLKGVMPMNYIFHLYM